MMATEVIGGAMSVGCNFWTLRGRGRIDNGECCGAVEPPNLSSDTVWSIQLDRFEPTPDAVSQNEEWRTREK